VPEEQDLLLYVDTTSLLAVIPISLHWVFTSSLFEWFSPTGCSALFCGIWSELEVNKLFQVSSNVL